MAATIQDLLTQAYIIRDAEQEGENTAGRVGTLFVDIISYFHEHEGQDIELHNPLASINSQLNSNPGDIGMTLIWSGSSWGFGYASSGGGGGTGGLNWSDLYRNTTEQINLSHLTGALNEYFGTNVLNGYSWWGRTFGSSKQITGALDGVTQINFTNGVSIGIDNNRTNTLRVFYTTNSNTPANIYATGAVSSLGYSAEGGSGGGDTLEALLTSLNTSGLPAPTTNELGKVLIVTSDGSGGVTWGWGNTGGGSASLNEPLSSINNIGAPTGDNNLVLLWNHNSNTWQYVPFSSGGGGGVNSVGLNSKDGVLTIEGSPITDAGTISISVANGYIVPTTQLWSNVVTKDLIVNGSIYTNRIPFIKNDYVMEIGRYIDFHYENNDDDYIVRLQLTNPKTTPSYSRAIVSLPTSSGTLALTTDITNALTNAFNDAKHTLFGNSNNYSENGIGTDWNNTANLTYVKNILVKDTYLIYNSYKNLNLTIANLEGYISYIDNYSNFVFGEGLKDYNVYLRGSLLTFLIKPNNQEAAQNAVRITNYGNIVLTLDSLYLNNSTLGYLIRHSSGNYCEIAGLQSNTMRLAYNAKDFNYATNIYGGISLNIHFLCGNDEIASIFKNTNMQGVRIGEAVLVWDSGNHALKVIASNGSACNFYATGGVSALGFSPIVSSLESFTITNLTSKNIYINASPSTFVIEGLYTGSGVLNIRSYGPLASGISISSSFALYGSTSKWGINVKGNGDASFSKVYLWDENNTRTMYTTYLHVENNQLKYYNGSTDITIA